jgi:hypothetical protein
MFLEPDPLGYEDSVNLYAGLGNNPVTLRDPSGLKTKESQETGQQSADEVASPSPPTPLWQVFTGMAGFGSIPAAAGITENWESIKSFGKGPGARFVQGPGIFLFRLGSSAFAGYRIGDGIRQWTEGERAHGATDVAAGTVNLGMGLVSAWAASGEFAFGITATSISVEAGSAFGVTTIGTTLEGGALTSYGTAVGGSPLLAAVGAAIAVEFARQQIHGAIDGEDVLTMRAARGVFGEGVHDNFVGAWMAGMSSKEYHHFKGRDNAEGERLRRMTIVNARREKGVPLTDYQARWVMNNFEVEDSYRRRGR